MRFEAFSFGSISIDGTTYGYDVVIDRGRIRKRKKKPSKRFRDRARHMFPLLPTAQYSCETGQDHHDGSPLKHFGSPFACAATIGKTEVNRIDFCGRVGE